MYVYCDTARDFNIAATLERGRHHVAYCNFQLPVTSAVILGVPVLSTVDTIGSALHVLKP